MSETSVFLFKSLQISTTHKTIFTWSSRISKFENTFDRHSNGQSSLELRKKVWVFSSIKSEPFLNAIFKSQTNHLVSRSRNFTRRKISKIESFFKTLWSIWLSKGGMGRLRLLRSDWPDSDPEQCKVVHLFKLPYFKVSILWMQYWTCYGLCLSWNFEMFRMCLGGFKIWSESKSHKISWRYIFNSSKIYKKTRLSLCYNKQSMRIFHSWTMLWLYGSNIIWSKHALWKLWTI